MEKFLWAFLLGGAICVIGQLLLDGLKAGQQPTCMHDKSTL